MWDTINDNMRGFLKDPSMMHLPIHEWLILKVLIWIRNE